MVAYHSVLIFNVLGVSGFDLFDVPRNCLPCQRKTARRYRSRCGSFLTAIAKSRKKNFQEVYHDAIQQRDEALNLFNLGYLSLELRSLTEKLFWGVCGKILKMLKENDHAGGLGMGTILKVCRRSCRTRTSAIFRCFRACRTRGRSSSCFR